MARQAQAEQWFRLSGDRKSCVSGCEGPWHDMEKATWSKMAWILRLGTDNSWQDSQRPIRVQPWDIYLERTGAVSPMSGVGWRGAKRRGSGSKPSSPTQESLIVMLLGGAHIVFSTVDSK